MQKNILVVEDHPLYRQALLKLLDFSLANISLSSCNSAEEALVILGKKTKAAEKTEWIVLLDLSLPGISGLSAIYEIQKINPDAKILVISATDDNLQVAASIGAGAKAFISKSAPPDLVVDLLNRFIKNEISKPEWITSEGERSIDQLPKVNLTARQIEVLLLICQGKTNRYIADSLNIIEATAKAHVSAIFRELNVLNRTQALLAAQRLGFKVDAASKS